MNTYNILTFNMHDGTSMGFFQVDFIAFCCHNHQLLCGTYAIFGWYEVANSFASFSDRFGIVVTLFSSSTRNRDMNGEDKNSLTILLGRLLCMVWQLHAIDRLTYRLSNPSLFCYSNKLLGTKYPCSLKFGNLSMGSEFRESVKLFYILMSLENQ